MDRQQAPVLSEPARRTLVLNAGYEPLSVVSYRRAMVLVMNGRATVLEQDHQHPVRTLMGDYERPTVIVLKRYVRIPHGRVCRCRGGCFEARWTPLRLLPVQCLHD